MSTRHLPKFDSTWLVFPLLSETSYLLAIPLNLEPLPLILCRLKDNKDPEHQEQHRLSSGQCGSPVSCILGWVSVCPTREGNLIPTTDKPEKGDPE